VFTVRSATINKILDIDKNTLTQQKRGFQPLGNITQDGISLGEMADATVNSESK